MADRRTIIRQWKSGSSRVLVTLVRAEGSSYRRPGAHVVIAANGEHAGTISGGCLEAEVVRKAEWMVRQGAVVERYSTLFDDTAEIPYGLGCGGVVDLLLEPVDTPEARAFLEALEASLSGKESRVATWLPDGGRPLARAIFGSDGRLKFASRTLGAAEIASVSFNGETAHISSGPRPLYLQKISAPLRLCLFGAGDDAKPLVTMAALLGWNVVVADGRAQLIDPARFPEAQQVLAVKSADELDLRSGDAVVLMTHSYEQDRQLLTGLLGAAEVPGYIGLLGASHRSSLLLSEAAATLSLSLESCCDKVWAPVGLNLGVQRPSPSPSSPKSRHGARASCLPRAA
jgi:xanthine dehydrogenase accessory factor